MDHLLAIDLGGTKCALGLFELRARKYTPVAREVHPSGRFQNIEEIVSLFLKKTEQQPVYACIGVAGVVEGKVARMTNLTWKLNADDIANSFGFQGVTLINDLTALCSAISHLDGAKHFVLQEGISEKGGTIGVLAPGTGLGEGYLLEDETCFLPKGSEGGHTNFSPVNDEQVALLQWLRQRYEVVSNEMVCAGPALFTIYTFLRSQGMVESSKVRDEIIQVSDKTPTIINNALGQQPCPLCATTVELFLSILGSEAGNLALKVYATRGIYLGGGILPRLVGKFSFTSFMDHFNQKGEMRKLVEKIPVKVIMEKDAVLHGVVRYGRRIFGK